MTYIEIFKGPPNTILDVPSLDKAILVLVQSWNNDLLHSICHDLSDEL
jgi:hypothetical protein